jgi:hypothetical protein
MKVGGIALFAIVGFAGSPPRIPNLPPVTLFTNQLDPSAAAVFAAMREEVANIMAPVGMHFEWHEITAESTAVTAVELAVVTFKGTCDVTTAVISGDKNKTLGFTNVSDGAILPFTTVDCDRARGFLDNALRRLPLRTRQTAFGRALGRILAHELYHIFANTSRHGHDGVAKEVYSVADLMSGEFEFQERECELMRGGRAFNSLVSSRTP